MKICEPLQIILITGPKHTGKSLIAKALEKLIDGKAFDLDDLVEKETGKSPRSLYKEDAELFRKAEERALASLILKAQLPQNQKYRIIAAGGGIIDNPEALALLPAPLLPSRNAEIFIVYLELSAKTAWQRIVRTAADGELPPFLNTKNPRKTHSTLHKRRAKAYKALAHLTVSAENKTPEEIAAEIARFL